MISEEERSVALEWLEATRERAAIEIAVEKAKFEAECCYQKAYLAASGPVAERQAWATLDGRHQDAMAEYFKVKEISIEASKREKYSEIICSQYQTDTKAYNSAR